MDDTRKAIEAMMAKIEALGMEAEQLCQRHLKFVLAMNKQKDWGSKSRLYASTRVRGYGLTANWYEVNWYGSKAANNRRMVKKLIKKPARGSGYNLSVLLGHSQPWEEDMVREVETGLAVIRRKAAIVSKVLLHLKQLERIEIQEGEA